MMNILLLGSGGREHALAWKLSQSPRCDELFIAPGNPGTAQCGTNVNIDPVDFAALKRFIAERNIEMLIPGPEAPLVAGVYDFFEGESVQVIGPSQRGAMLEGSKDFAKAFMTRHNIPTAEYRSFTSESSGEARAFLDQVKLPVVLKADGLAAGKGVVICNSAAEAKDELNAMFRGKFGGAGDTVVVEEFLSGKEVSVFVLTDGEHFKLLPTAKDYKRIGEGDTGPNTGGMGAVSPVPFADTAFMKKVGERIVAPVIAGMREERIMYNGVLYCGLMSVNGDPYVIEFNCRLGDPEAQVVLPRLKNDLVEVFEAIARGSLNETVIETDDRACSTVVLTSRGYPGDYEKGKRITLPEQHADAIFFHSGTQLNERGELITSGGRVMAVTAFGNDLENAITKSRDLAKQVSFEGKYFRSDIGDDVFTIARP